MKYKLKFIATMFSAALILMWYTFYNGYPLVTGDSGAYLNAAFCFGALKDRSPFYSLFAAVAGLRTLAFAGVRGSMWLPVFFQCLLIAGLLMRYYAVIAGATPRKYKLLLMVGLIALTTGVSFVAAYLMPDVFAGILLLVFVLYLFDDKATFNIRVMYICIMALSVMVHNSHFLILPMCAGILLLVAWLGKWRSVSIKLLHTIGVSIICWIILCSLHYVKGFGFVLSPSSHVFMAGRLIETGVMKQYLDDQCPIHSNELCAYKDNLPERAYQYIWADDGAFQKIGGWDHSHKTHNKIIRDIFTTPVYFKQFAKQSITDTWLQLCNIHLPIGEQSFGVESSPFSNIYAHVKSEIPQFRNAQQQLGTINNTGWVNLQFWVFILSMAWVAILLISGKMHRHQWQIYLAVVVFIICNAFVTATFGNVLERLQNRVFWVLPATNIIVLLQYYTGKIKRNASA